MRFINHGVALKSAADFAFLLHGFHYKKRPEEPVECYARRVGMDEIEANDWNLNISRYVSTAEQEQEIDLAQVHKDLVSIEDDILVAATKHNQDCPSLT